MKLEDFECDAYWVPIDEEFPSFAVWNNRVITVQKNERNGMGAAFQSKLQDIEAAAQYTKYTESDWYLRHAFSNSEKLVNNLSQKQIDPLFFVPDEDYAFMRDKCSLDLCDENVGFSLLGTDVFGSFQPALEPWIISDKPFILQCGFKKSFKKSCHKAGKIWKKHKTEIIIGGLILVTVVVAAVMLTGAEVATLAVAGGALLEQLNTDDSFEQNTPMLQHFSQNQIEQQTKNTEVGFLDFSKSPEIKSLDSLHFAQNENAISQLEDLSFSEIPGQFQIDCRPSRPPSVIEQKTKNSNSLLSDFPSHNKTCPDDSLQANYKESASPFVIPKYSSGINPLNPGFFSKSSSPQNKGNATDFGVPYEMEPSRGFASSSKTKTTSSFDHLPEEAAWEHLWNNQLEMGFLSKEEREILREKFPNSFSEPLDPNVTPSQRTEEQKQRQLAWRKAIGEALVSVGSSATDLSYSNFAAKAFKGEAFNDFISPPPFGALPIIGLPSQGTIHALGGIANSDITTVESCYCLHETLEKEFAIQPHRLHSDNIVNGLMMVALEKLNETEHQATVANWLPFVQEVDGALSFARVLAKSVVKSSKIQESIDYTTENFSRLADEIIQKKKPNLKQVHVSFSNAGHVCKEALKRLTPEQRETIIIIPVGTTAIIEDDLACKVFNVIGDKDWPSIYCNGGMKGINEKSEKATVEMITQDQTKPLIFGHYFVQPEYQITIKDFIDSKVVGVYEIY